MDETSRAMDGVQAQQAVIGSMLIDDRCVGVVLSQLVADDFTDSACKHAFQTIKRLFTSGNPVDPITVLEAVGGGERYAGWIKELMDITPTAANVEAYGEIVRRQTALFRLREQADKMAVVADLDEAKAIVREMNGLVSISSRNDTWTAAELAQDFHRRMTSTEKPEYLTWGFPKVDRASYAELGDVIFLGGHASSGKTLLSVVMALNQAKRYKIGYYTLETQREKMADRMFAHLCKISLGRIKERGFNESELAKMATAESLFVAETPIEFTHATGWTADDIASHALSRGYQIIYIDYLQLIRGPEKTEYDRVTAASQALKVFAQSNSVAVVALSQLARAEKAKDGKWVPPSMNSFRSSGQIEQDADLAFLLWPEDMDDNRSNRILKLAKNKEGERTKATLYFDGATQTMVEMEEKPDTSVARQLAAAGRVAKAANRAKAQQMQFSELSGNDQDNPFA